jgi:hypothetical protein
MQQLVIEFKDKDSIRYHIKNVLEEGGVPPGYIDNYIDCVLTYSSIEDYVGVTDEVIWDDFSDWMDDGIDWKAK